MSSDGSSVPKIPIEPARSSSRYTASVVQSERPSSSDLASFKKQVGGGWNFPPQQRPSSRSSATSGQQPLLSSTVNGTDDIELVQQQSLSRLSGLIKVGSAGGSRVPQKKQSQRSSMSFSRLSATSSEPSNDLAQEDSQGSGTPPEQIGNQLPRVHKEPTEPRSGRSSSDHGSSSKVLVSRSRMMASSSSLMRRLNAPSQPPDRQGQRAEKAAVDAQSDLSAPLVKWHASGDLNLTNGASSVASMTETEESGPLLPQISTKRPSSTTLDVLRAPGTMSTAERVVTPVTASPPKPPGDVQFRAPKVQPGPSVSHSLDTDFLLRLQQKSPLEQSRRKSLSLSGWDAGHPVASADDRGSCRIAENDNGGEKITITAEELALVNPPRPLDGTVNPVHEPTDQVRMIGFRNVSRV